MTLAAENLHFGYAADQPVLRGVSCEIGPGAITVVVGPNGCGKSTLLRVLLGALRPQSGRVTLDGRDVQSIPPPKRAARLAYLAQRPTLGFGYTLYQYVRLGLHAAGDDQDGAVDSALERVGLMDRAGWRFGELSVGQQQRAALARALAQLARRAEGAVLLADEPLSAMDPRRALESLQLLRERARAGAAVALVLHDLSLAATWADRALLLDADGRPAAAGPAAETLREDRLRAIFGVRFERLLASDGSVALAAQGEAASARTSGAADR
ncbi:MAG: ABC transporter ATP-binding protein [Phycisphaerales bacterium JB039]